VTSIAQVSGQSCGQAARTTVVVIGIYFLGIPWNGLIVLQKLFPGHEINAVNACFCSSFHFEDGGWPIA
jgi:hypothetical protein